MLCVLITRITKLPYNFSLPPSVFIQSPFFILHSSFYSSTRRHTTAHVPSLCVLQLVLSLFEVKVTDREGLPHHLCLWVIRITPKEDVDRLHHRRVCVLRVERVTC